jgi:hypothetical protein
MKKFLFLLLLTPALAKAQFTIVNISTTNLLELRNGTWPLTLERQIKELDTCYVLDFRDQQTTTDVNMATLRFGDLNQLKYFQKGLSSLKNGHSGDIARFKEYTIKRMDVKKQGSLYVLTCNDGALTNFQQPEADKMIATIQVQ